MLVVSSETIYKYSLLSTEPKPMTYVRDGSLLWEIDTGKKFEWRGDDWYPEKTVVSINDESVITYEDDTYLYVCKSIPGSQLTDPVWQIKRINMTSVAVQWADGNTNYDNVATDLGVVAALIYSF